MFSWQLYSFDKLFLLRDSNDISFDKETAGSQHRLSILLFSAKVWLSQAAFPELKSRAQDVSVAVTVTVHWAQWALWGTGTALTAAEGSFLKGMKLFTEHRGGALQLFKTLFLLPAPCGFMFQHHIVNCTYLQLQLNSWTQYGKHSHPLKPRKYQGILGNIHLPFTLVPTQLLQQYTVEFMVWYLVLVLLVEASRVGYNTKECVFMVAMWNADRSSSESCYTGRQSPGVASSCAQM